MNKERAEWRVVRRERQTQYTEEPFLQPKGRAQRRGVAGDRAVRRLRTGRQRSGCESSRAVVVPETDSSNAAIETQSG